MARSLSDQFSFSLATDLRLITTENVDVECAAFKLVNMCCGKNCLRLDLLDCEDILLCCSGSTDLVFNWRCKLRWKPLNIHGSYLVPSCLRTEMKNLDIGRSKSLVGIFTIALDSFSDSQKSSMRLSRSKSCIECVWISALAKTFQFRLHFCS